MSHSLDPDQDKCFVSLDLNTMGSRHFYFYKSVKMTNYNAERSCTGKVSTKQHRYSLDSERKAKIFTVNLGE